jgi:hypothetical protein
MTAASHRELDMLERPQRPGTPAMTTAVEFRTA